MRDILFRGMTVNGKFVEGNLSILKNDLHYSAKIDKGCYISNSCGAPFAYQVRPETIGQFTGLIDKNGKRVFEGDIVAIDVCQKRERIDSDGNKLHVFEINKPKIQETAVVEYCSKRGKFDTGTPEICFDFASDFYIIGNIHDNPELLS